MATTGKPRRARRYVGMGKTDRAAARREELLTAGIRVVGTVGFAGAKVRDVCAEAGLSERYFYESFDGVADFNKALLHEVAITASLRIITAVLKERDAAAQVRTIFAELVSLAEDTPERGRLILLETVRAGGELAAIRANILATTANMARLLISAPPDFDLGNYIDTLIARILNGQIAGNEFAPPADPVTVAMAGATAELLGEWLDDRIDITGPQLSDLLYQMFQRIVDLGVPATSRHN